MSNEKAATNQSQYIVAVGAAASGKTMALDSLIDGNGKKYALRIPYTEGMRQSRVDAFLKKKKCTVITVEALLDVEARDTFIELINRVVQQQKHVGKHVHQETRSFFEVPQALRQHVSAVVVFRSANEDERRRIYRYFAQTFFAKREEFDEALNALVDFDCLLMDKRNNNVCVYNAKDGTKKVLMTTAASFPAPSATVEAKEGEGAKDGASAPASSSASSSSSSASAAAVAEPANPETQVEKKDEKKPIGYKKWLWSWLGY